MYLASNNIPYRDRVALPAHGLWTVCAISGPIALCARTLFGKYSLLFSQIGNQALKGGPNQGLIKRVQHAAPGVHVSSCERSGHKPQPPAPRTGCSFRVSREPSTLTYLVTTSRGGPQGNYHRQSRPFCASRDLPPFTTPLVITLLRPLALVLPGRCSGLVPLPPLSLELQPKHE
jgi:hypothetical protein